MADDAPVVRASIDHDKDRPMYRWRASAGIYTSLCLIAALHAGDNWPQWRGPTDDGRSDSTSLPTEWNLEKYIAWKAELPSWSGGTPVIWRERIFVTSPNKANPASGGREPTEPGARGQQTGGKGGTSKGGFGGKFGGKGGGRGQGR